VISGPGAALWGANAVNGVNQRDHAAILGYPRAGTRMREAATSSAATARATAARSARTDRIASTAGLRHLNTSRVNGATASDGWSKGQVGFRTDWGTAVNGFTLQGDAYRGSLDPGARRRFEHLRKQFARPLEPRPRRMGTAANSIPISSTPSAISQGLSRSV